MPNENNNWKNKYLFYKQKNNELRNKINNLNQFGGDDNDKSKYMKILKKIKEGLKTKGYVFWFDKTGKVLSQGLNSKEAKEKMVNIIVNDKEKWKNEIITELVIEFIPSDIMEENLGGLSISVDLNKIIMNGDKLSIQMKNKENSLFTMRYKYDELKLFKLSDLKKLSLFVSNETFKKFKSDIYQYNQIVNFL